jgi:hypothetical protein
MERGDSPPPAACRPCTCPYAQTDDRRTLEDRVRNLEALCRLLANQRHERVEERHIGEQQHSGVRVAGAAMGWGGVDPRSEPVPGIGPGPMLADKNAISMHFPEDMPLADVSLEERLDRSEFGPKVPPRKVHQETELAAEVISTSDTTGAPVAPVLESQEQLTAIPWDNNENVGSAPNALPKRMPCSRAIMPALSDQTLNSFFVFGPCCRPVLTCLRIAVLRGLHLWSCIWRAGIRVSQIFRDAGQLPSSCPNHMWCLPTIHH